MAVAARARSRAEPTDADLVLARGSIEIRPLALLSA